MATRYCTQHQKDCHFCDGKSKQTGEPCANHIPPAAKVCKFHGGTTKHARQAQEQREALQTAQHEAESLLARPQDRDPVDHMAEVLSRAQSTAMSLRLLMENDRTRATQDETGLHGLIVIDRHGVFQAHPLLAECRQWENQAATIAFNMTKGGIAERQTKLSELQVTLMVQRVRGFTIEAGLDPTSPPVAALLQRWFTGEPPIQPTPNKLNTPHQLAA